MDEAVARLGKQGNKISRVESGKIGIDRTDLDALPELYQASEKDQLWCRELNRTAKPKRGRPASETTLYLGPRWFRAFRDLEADASEIMQVRSEIITGILPTTTSGPCSTHRASTWQTNRGRHAARPGGPPPAAHAGERGTLRVRAE